MEEGMALRGRLNRASFLGPFRGEDKEKGQIKETFAFRKKPEKIALDFVLDT